MKRAHAFLIASILFLSPGTSAFAQSEGSSSSTSSNAPAQTASGTDTWQLRTARTQGFTTGWQTFAPVFSGWQNAWTKAHDQFVSHVDRCHTEFRGANRDTLLPVTLRCYRGQLLLEQQALKSERDILATWPGITEAVRTDALQKTDALLGAIPPVLDAIDARVFTTTTTFLDVRKNLLTQYRQPYGKALAHLRADAARTWLASLLLNLQPLLTDSSLMPEAVQKVTTALACYENADAPLASAVSAATTEESVKDFTEATTRLKDCRTPLIEAQSLQKSSSSSSSSTLIP